MSRQKKYFFINNVPDYYQPESLAVIADGYSQEDNFAWLEKIQKYFPASSILWIVPSDMNTDDVDKPRVTIVTGAFWTNQPFSFHLLSKQQLHCCKKINYIISTSDYDAYGRAVKPWEKELLPIIRKFKLRYFIHDQIYNIVRVAGYRGIVERVYIRPFRLKVYGAIVKAFMFWARKRVTPNNGWTKIEKR